jgi:hypothetical protein
MEMQTRDLMYTYIARRRAEPKESLRGINGMIHSTRPGLYIGHTARCRIHTAVLVLKSAEEVPNSGVGFGAGPIICIGFKWENVGL